MQDDAVTIDAASVEALARLSRTYECALVTREECVEQGDGDFDLECTELPDGRHLYTFAQDNPPQNAADGDGVTVLKLVHALEAALWFATEDAWHRFHLEIEGVTDTDGDLLEETDSAFIDGLLAPGFYTIGFTPE